MSTVKCSLVSGSSKTSTCINAALDGFNAVSSFLSYLGNPARLSFCCCPFSRTTITAKFGTNRQNTYHSPKNSLSSIWDVGYWSPRTAFAVHDAFFRCLGLMRCPGKSMVIAKKRHFMSLMVAPASLWKVSILQTTTVCFSDNFEKLTLLLR